MNKIKFAMGAGTAWLAIFAGHLQAYIVDWNASYKGHEIFWQKEGVRSTALIYRAYGWDRAVQLWQSFSYFGTNVGLSAIAFHLNPVISAGSMDLNVYSGVGVDGSKLISSTKLEWDIGFIGGWYAFRLNKSVVMGSPTGEENYSFTIALENLHSETPFVVSINDKNPSVPSNMYLQQGYFGLDEVEKVSPKGYLRGVPVAAVNFILLN